jgi:hypothetical protein
VLLNACSQSDCPASAFIRHCLEFFCFVSHVQQFCMLPHFTLIFAVEACSLAESRAVTARQQLILPFLKGGSPVPGDTVGADPILQRVKADEKWCFLKYRMSVFQAQHRDISLVEAGSLACIHHLRARAPDWLEDAAYKDLKKSFARKRCR